MEVLNKFGSSLYSQQLHKSLLNSTESLFQNCLQLVILYHSLQPATKAYHQRLKYVRIYSYHESLEFIGVVSGYSVSCPQTEKPETDISLDKDHHIQDIVRLILSGYLLILVDFFSFSSNCSLSILFSSCSFVNSVLLHQDSAVNNTNHIINITLFFILIINY